MNLFLFHSSLFLAVALSARIARVRLSLQAFFRRGMQSEEFRLGLLLAGFFLGACLGIAKALALDFGAWDQGIFQQVLYSLSHGQGFHYTLEGDRSYLSTHFSPYLAPLALISRLFSNSPLFLPVVSSAFIFGGVFAWTKIANKEDPSGKLSLAVILFALCFDSFWANLRLGFHETEVYFFAVSWLLYFLSAARFLPSFIFACVAASTKETAWLDVGLLLLFFPLKAERKLGYRASGILFLLFFGLVLKLKPTDGGNGNWIAYLYGYLGGSSPWQIALSVLSHPFSTLSKIEHQISLPSLLVFVLSVFGFFAFASRGKLLIALIPSLLLYGLAAKPSLRDLNYHYALTLWPVLFFTAISWLKKRDSRLILWVATAYFFSWLSPLTLTTHETAVAFQRSDLRRALSDIPERDSLWMEDDYSAYLSARSQVYARDEFFEAVFQCPKWVILKSPHPLPRCPIGQETWLSDPLHFYQSQ